MTALFFLILGISGVIAIGLNYILEATNKLPQDHKLFSVINLYGAFTLTIYSLYNEIYLFLILNGFLMIIGIIGLYKVYKKPKKS